MLHFWYSVVPTDFSQETFQMDWLRTVKKIPNGKFLLGFLENTEKDF